MVMSTSSMTTSLGLLICGEYLYLVGGATVLSLNDNNSSYQAWKAKWSDVKQTASLQRSQTQRSVWTQMADPSSPNSRLTWRDSLNSWWIRKR